MHTCHVWRDLFFMSVHFEILVYIIVFDIFAIFSNFIYWAGTPCTPHYANISGKVGKLKAWGISGFERCGSWVWTAIIMYWIVLPIGLPCYTISTHWWGLRTFLRRTTKLNKIYTTLTINGFHRQNSHPHWLYRFESANDTY